MRQLASRLNAFLLKPVEGVEPRRPRPERPILRSVVQPSIEALRPVAVEATSQLPATVAVVGFKSGCGATTVACGLAHGFAKRCCGAAVVVTSDRIATGGRGKGFGSYRIARGVQAELAGRGMAACETGNIGPVCLAVLPAFEPGLVVNPYVKALTNFAAGRLPLIWDVGASESHLLQTAVLSAELLIVVVDEGSDQELVQLTTKSLLGRGYRQLVVANGSAHAPEFTKVEAGIPRSRLGVWQLRRGAYPRGTLGEAVELLVERCAV